MDSTKAGFLTVAFGERYAEMALDMALSAREYHSERVSIAVDAQTHSYLARYQPSPFDQIITLPQKVHAWGAKFLAAEASPYSVTMFVDADILFLRSAQELFHRDYGAPLAMLGTFVTPERDVVHQGFSTAAICADFGLSRYLWTNAGLFVFKSNQAREMFRECYDFYVSGIRKHPQYLRGNVPDELVFGIVGAAHHVGFIGDPRPMPYPEEIPLMTPLDSQWPLIHLIGRPNNEFMDHLVSEMARRRREFGLPIVSEKIWRQKAQPTPTIWQKAVHKCRTTARKLRTAS